WAESSILRLGEPTTGLTLIVTLLEVVAVDVGSPLAVAGGSCGTLPELVLTSSANLGLADWIPSTPRPGRAQLVPTDELLSCGAVRSELSAGCCNGWSLAMSLIFGSALAPRFVLNGWAVSSALTSLDSAVAAGGSCGTLPGWALLSSANLGLADSIPST